MQNDMHLQDINNMHQALNLNGSSSFCKQRNKTTYLNARCIENTIYIFLKEKKKKEI